MSAESERRTEEIPEWKRAEVDDLVAMLESYESIGVVDVAGIPSRQLQAMRRELHGRARLRISRNTLMRRALEDVDEGVEVLTESVTGQVGLIGTDDNPFALFRHLEASKTPAPIGAGETAPNDIVIEAGDTGMDPGPFVGELQQVGARASIDAGSIVVHEDSTVLEAGGTVDQQLANVLAELGIEPKEVGLDLRAVFADDVVFEPDELAIDIDAYRADVRAAAAAGRNLSVNAGYPTDRTMAALLARASGEATALGLAASVESPALAEQLVARADAQVRALAGLMDDDALPEELREVAAPREPQATSEPTDDQSADEPTEETEAVDDDDEDEDEDDSAGAEGLGDLFG